MTTEFVTIVIPVRDEESTVSALLESLSRQSVGAHTLDVLVYDGDSRDATRSVSLGFQHRAAWARYEVRQNASLTVPHALNDALADALGRWFMRLDGRTHVSDDYIELCLERVRRESGPVAAGGRFVAHADGALPNAIAAAVTHRLVVGRSFRTESEPAELTHHPFSLWETDRVRTLGGFDSALIRNQDDEFSMRARRSGARILLEPRATVVYRPRDRLRGVCIQYFQYGLWKAVVARRGGGFPARSAVPPVVSLALGGSILLVLFGRSRIPAATFATTYLGLGLIVSRRRRAQPVLTGLAVLTVHASYGAGVLAGLARPALGRGRLGSARVR